MCITLNILWIFRNFLTGANYARGLMIICFYYNHKPHVNILNKGNFLISMFILFIKTQNKGK